MLQTSELPFEILRDPIRHFFQPGSLSLDKKQNPAFGGICCSQLVLVTQTLPKKIRGVTLQKFIENLPKFIG